MPAHPQDRTAEVGVRCERHRKASSTSPTCVTVPRWPAPGHTVRRASGTRAASSSPCRSGTIVSASPWKTVDGNPDRLDRESPRLGERRVVGDDAVRAAEEGLGEQRHRLGRCAEGRHQRAVASFSCFSKLFIAALGMTRAMRPVVPSRSRASHGRLVASAEHLAVGLLELVGLRPHADLAHSRGDDRRRDTVGEQRRARGRVRPAARVSPHREPCHAELRRRARRPSPDSRPTVHDASAARQADAGPVGRDQAQRRARAPGRRPTRTRRRTPACRGTPSRARRPDRRSRTRRRSGRRRRPLAVPEPRSSSSSSGSLTRVDSLRP